MIISSYWCISNVLLAPGLEENLILITDQCLSHILLACMALFCSSCFLLVPNFVGDTRGPNCIKSTIWLFGKLKLIHWQKKGPKNVILLKCRVISRFTNLGDCWCLTSVASWYDKGSQIRRQWGCSACHSAAEACSTELVQLSTSVVSGACGWVGPNCFNLDHH